MNTLVWYNASKHKFEFGTKEDYFERKASNEIVFEYMLVGKRKKDQLDEFAEKLNEGVTPQ